MKSSLVVFLIAGILAALSSAAPVDDVDDGAVVDQAGGWFVPQQNGSVAWMDEEEFFREQEEYAKEDALWSVDFHLYTRKSPKSGYKLEPGNAQSIENSEFASCKKLKFSIHGWLNSHNSDICTMLRDSWLFKEDVCVICVRWNGAHHEYVLATTQVENVGRKTADLIDFMHVNYGFPLENVHVVGHSLGAHAAGFTGKYMQTLSGKLPRIDGLDPAGPGFKLVGTQGRFDAGDAQLTIAIHTNGGGLGLLSPIAKVDYYVNGGKSQPMCSIDLGGICSHNMCPDYYSEVIIYNNFLANRCESQKHATKNKCSPHYGKTTMAAQNIPLTYRGIYRVDVNKKSIYGKGTPKYS